ncbi:hypothetical protein EVAR_55905_1 [Eumeta japonica]|uniref:Uncharacterized protein n=1 Tax=Eumeta variegata TaxID=151549 RepID=A0A4C1YIR4_EUMVA|nr:hypothetical protein EVAR_55905_1 [Eumeta japonica]
MRGLNLSKRGSVLLASRPKEKSLLAPAVTVKAYRTRKNGNTAAALYIAHQPGTTRLLSSLRFDLLINSTYTGLVALERCLRPTADDDEVVDNKDALCGIC